MNDSTFTPSGATVLVGTTIVQVPPLAPNEVQATSYRVRCLVTGYLAWYPMLANNATPTAAALAAAAPGAASSPNTIGMTAGSVETFGLPQNAWFVSSVVAGFEVTPGEGL